MQRPGRDQHPIPVSAGPLDLVRSRGFADAARLLAADDRDDPGRMLHDPRIGCGGARDTEALCLHVEFGADTLRTSIVARLTEASTRQGRPGEHRNPLLHGELERPVRKRFKHQR